jgi:peptidoglycan/LPS O-acetylase OafA/YrhL
MHSKKPGEHLLYIENFRAIAIVLVILSHLSAWQHISQSLSISYKFHFGNATTVFVFISGFLFKYLADEKGYDYFYYMKAKCKNVLSPYLFFSLIATTVAILSGRYMMYGLTVDSFALWSLLVGGAVVAPLWFIPMIFLFFFLSPLLIRVSNSRFFAAFLMIFMLLSLFTSRPYYNQNPFLSCIHFSGFFFLGMFFSIKSVRNSVLISGDLKYLVLLVSTAIYMFSYFCCKNDLSNDAVGFYFSMASINYHQLGKLSLIIFLFIVLKNTLNTKVKILAYVANISFGLFFTHGFFIAAFNSIATRYYINSSLLYFILEMLFAVGLSIFFIELVRRVLGNKRSRYVVGC